jgi:hypothetical protein
VCLHALFASNAKLQKYAENATKTQYFFQTNETFSCNCRLDYLHLVHSQVVLFSDIIETPRCIDLRWKIEDSSDRLNDGRLFIQPLTFVLEAK